MIGGAVALTTLSAAARHQPDPVARAMAAAGGFALLSRIRVASWSGAARAVLGGTPVDLEIEMRIEPFVRARSDTWQPGDGRSVTRTIMVEPDSAFIVERGAQVAMPPEQARFQRQQMGVYSYLLLAPALVTAASVRRLNAARDGYPPIALTLGPDGRIAQADYAIASPDPAMTAVRQQLLFAGTISAQGVRFPRMISIVEAGRPVWRTTLTDFAVELAA